MDALTRLLIMQGLIFPVCWLMKRANMSLTRWCGTKVMDVNLKGVFLCAQAVGRVMVKQGYGVIVNMSSECGLEGSEGQSVYAASKNAVNSLTRSWAKELGEKRYQSCGNCSGHFGSHRIKDDWI